jgi:hypothetical protein
MKDPTDRLSLGSVGILAPRDEVALADECVRRHGMDMQHSVEKSDPGRDAIGVGDIGEIHNGMETREPAMEQPDPVGEDLEIGATVSSTELNDQLDL